MLTLLRPQYTNRNLAAITASAKARYESLSEKTLYDAQPERLMLDVVAYMAFLIEQHIQEAAEQNLVQFAAGEALDHHAQLFGVTRLAALKAKTTLRFTAQEAAPSGSRPVSVVIPVGTRVRSQDGNVMFETLSSVEIAMNETTKDVAAEAVEAGAAANDYQPGSITELLTTVAWLESVSNTVLSHSGADAETDTQLRERTVQAPESFSVAGPVGAYRYHALAAHPGVIDVAVESDLPGKVNVYPLATGGTPSEEILTAVREAVSHEKKRPLTDVVSVIAPAAKTFSIAATVTLYNAVPSVETKALIEERLQQYATEKRKKLGRDVVPNHIIALIQSIPGVYNATLVQTAVLTVLPREFADCTSITVTLSESINEEPVTYQY